MSSVFLQIMADVRKSLPVAVKTYSRIVADRTAREQDVQRPESLRSFLKIQMMRKY
jgi:hypothetical protein